MTRTAKSISVVIPVLHEAAAINAVIAHLRSLAGASGIEIIVVDGDPAAETIRVIADPEVMRVRSNPGRASQMNRGAAIADGNILLFLHADTMLPPDAFEQVASAVRDPAVVGGSFELGIASSQRIFRLTERYVALRTRLTRVPFGDQAIFLRRDYFASIGGYREIPIMEDVELMKRIKKRGDHIRIIPERVLTSPRRWEREGIVYGTLRNWSMQLCYGLGVSPERLARWYH